MRIMRPRAKGYGKFLFSSQPLSPRCNSSARRHPILSSDNRALVILGNLRLLLGCVNAKRESLENWWSRALDKRPRAAEQMLNALMHENQVSSNPNHSWKTVKNIVNHDFSTLGVGRWVNDEIINYFVEKWCSGRGRTTLGLGTFFASKHLFQQNSCLTAKSGALTEEDEAKTRLGLETWDSVFIPIHEDNSHWYSVYIDFRCKRIEIYDSLRERCEANRQKPVAQRKNTNLMLILMWLTEVLGRLRGDDVCLSKNPGTDWICDPHSKVHFQPNVATRIGTTGTRKHKRKHEHKHKHKAQSTDQVAGKLQRRRSPNLSAAYKDDEG
ncbi:hypothetical protein D9757_013413 [Collybiopsis confluens]|uniref:Ubiquitin-like protease family profile domain-containing protein n=1 Tax=Collybiopsis confluens TaxID=2823264 RepID=A0A8H5FSC5_9AGAR|nr:hypothetical protein D9757_013413 [Collybiopsis confluens]